MTDIEKLRHVFNLLDDRVDMIESDLDCDKDGSLAQAIGELRDEVSDLRARIEEWVPRVVADETKREAA